MLSGLLMKDPNRRLGGGPDDANDIMAHPFFSCINWSDLQAKRVRQLHITCFLFLRDIKLLH